MLGLYFPAYVNHDARKIDFFSTLDSRKRASALDQTRYTFRQLHDNLIVELTQRKYASLAGFVKAEQDWSRPTISFTTTVLSKLETALQDRETPLHNLCHFILYLFAVAYHELGHLLGRWVSQIRSLAIFIYQHCSRQMHRDKFIGTPENSRARIHSRAPDTVGEGGEIVEENAFGALLELSDGTCAMLKLSKRLTFKSLGRIRARLSGSNYKVLRDANVAITLSFLLSNVDTPSQYQRNVPIFTADCWSALHSAAYFKTIVESQAREAGTERLPTYDVFFDVGLADFSARALADAYEVQRAETEAARKALSDSEIVKQELALRKGPISPLGSRSSRQEASTESEVSFSAPSLQFPEMALSSRPLTRADNDTPSAPFASPGWASCIVNEPVPFTQAQLDAVGLRRK
jgi:hypothetical protein